MMPPVSAYQFDDGHLLERSLPARGPWPISWLGGKGLHPAAGTGPAAGPSGPGPAGLKGYPAAGPGRTAYGRVYATAEAFAAIKEAEETIGRREMAEGRLGAELQYLRAHRRISAGQVWLPEMLRPGLCPGLSAPRIVVAFPQIRQLDTQFIAGNITPPGPITSRTAMEIYGQLLRDPEAGDWTFPPHGGPGGHHTCFRPVFRTLVLGGPDAQRAGSGSRDRRPGPPVSLLEYASARRAALLALRWILEAPEGRLPAQSSPGKAADPGPLPAV